MKLQAVLTSFVAILSLGFVLGCSSESDGNNFAPSSIANRVGNFNTTSGSANAQFFFVNKNEVRSTTVAGADGVVAVGTYLYRAEGDTGILDMSFPSQDQLYNVSLFFTGKTGQGSFVGNITAPNGTRPTVGFSGNFTGLVRPEDD